MSFLVVSKYKEDPIKVKALTWSQFLTLFIDFFKCSMAANSEVSDGIYPKIKLIPTFMDGLVTCKNDDDPSKNEGTR